MLVSALVTKVAQRPAEVVVADQEQAVQVLEEELEQV